MSPSDRSDNRPRRYKARAIGCPYCNAAAGEPCIALGGSMMNGVHRARDLAWNRIEWLKRTGAPTLEGSRS